MTLTFALSTGKVNASPALQGETDFTAIDVYLNTQLHDLGIPGMPGGIVQDGQMAHLQGFILIDAGEGLLPEGMDLQGKRGFAMPFGPWLKGPLRDVLEDALSPASTRARGLFDPRAVRELLEDFLRGRCDWARPWLLMMTELWCRETLDRPARPGGAGKGTAG